MKKIFLLIIVFIFIGCGSSQPNPCIIAEDFIKMDLVNPETINYSILNCNKEQIDENTYTVLTYVTAKSNFGVEKKIYYKLKLQFNGGVDVDVNNWSLLDIKSE